MARRRDTQLIDDVLHAVVRLGHGDGAGASRFAGHRALQRDDAVLDVHVDVAAAQDVLVHHLRVDLHHQPAVLDGADLGAGGRRKREHSEQRENQRSHPTTQSKHVDLLQAS